MLLRQIGRRQRHRRGAGRQHRPRGAASGGRRWAAPEYRNRDS